MSNELTTSQLQYIPADIYKAYAASLNPQHWPFTPLWFAKGDYFSGSKTNPTFVQNGTAMIAIMDLFELGWIRLERGAPQCRRPTTTAPR